mmetsp:Transcript_18287/g.30044  ORF Transcript_18287/g.30044 Transcript_18287/m.30044 type:complete len:203 (+) Transcript_18287:240-848(+)
MNTWRQGRGRKSYVLHLSRGGNVAFNSTTDRFGDPIGASHDESPRQLQSRCRISMSPYRSETRFPGRGDCSVHHHFGTGRRSIITDGVPLDVPSPMEYSPLSLYDLLYLTQSTDRPGTVLPPLRPCEASLTMTRLPETPRQGQGETSYRLILPPATSDERRKVYEDIASFEQRNRRLLSAHELLGTGAGEKVKDIHRRGAFR